MNVIFIYNSNVFSSIRLIQKFKAFTANYPADVPPKLLDVFFSPHYVKKNIKRIYKQK